MLAAIPSATLLGVDGHPVDVEVHVSSGLPGFTVVGLPDVACREARERVRAAIHSSQLKWPQKRITVNLAPSTVRKIGSGLDLPVAVGILVASDQLPVEAVRGLGCFGELGLDGSIRPVAGTVSLVGAVGADAVAVPQVSVDEARLVGDRTIRPVASLGELVGALVGLAPWPDVPPRTKWSSGGRPPDLADVRGQPFARFALEVAAAGGHHLLLTGPPGAGKTMLAQRLPGLLPLLTREQALEVTRIHSVLGLTLPAEGLVRRPPFRAPHHGASSVALVGGGGGIMRPGEISAAHHGVLFLDEMGEFQADVLNALRQPLEEGVIRVARARASLTFPAQFLLVGATNPCPCGDGGPPGSCCCSDAARVRYHRRFSGPLLDRFDLRVEVARPTVTEVLSGSPGESSTVVAARVQQARERAAARGITFNSELGPRRLDEVAAIEPAAASLLEMALREGRLSARGLARVRRVALTIADLRNDEPPLTVEHVALALSLRTSLSAGLVGAR